MAFTFRKLELAEVIEVKTQGFSDPRGVFAELYRKESFAQNGISENFNQDNFSRSKKDVLRGLHYQTHPAAQGKLVAVLRGEIYDVAADIRKKSPTYGKWIAVTLRAEEYSFLYVPPGFAHGFCVLSGEAEVLYKVTAEYAPAQDRGIIWNDPDLNIPWPVKEPLLSEKDAKHPRLKDAENNFIYGE